MLRTIARPEGFAVVCSTQWIRRRLIENGVPAECCVVIRPGIDFGAIQKVRKSSLRNDQGIAEDDYVVLLPEPGSRGHSHRAAFWAGSLLNHLEGRYKVIVPGTTREVERIIGFALTLPTAPTLIAPGDAIPVENLVAIADALVVPDTGDVPTTAIAWAMGAGAAVIAAASYAVTELIVSKVNGLLYKHPEGKSPALRIIPLLRDRESQRKVKEAARGQAYEVFSLRRYVDQHIQVYENLLAGVSPSKGITDPAQVA
jgi:glycosyltransferase involved in cell wall biosynthesis